MAETDDTVTAGGTVVTVGGDDADVQLRLQGTKYHRLDCGRCRQYPDDSKKTVSKQAAEDFGYEAAACITRGVTIFDTPDAEPGVYATFEAARDADPDAHWVRLPRDGDKYHTEGCRSGGYDTVVVARPDAKARGYTAAQCQSPSDISIYTAVRAEWRDRDPDEPVAVTQSLTYHHPACGHVAGTETVAMDRAAARAHDALTGGQCLVGRRPDADAAAGASSGGDAGPARQRYATGVNVAAVDVQIERGDPATGIAIRTSGEDGVNIPLFMMHALGWDAGADYELTRKDGVPLLRRGGDHTIRQMGGRTGAWSESFELKRRLADFWPFDVGDDVTVALHRDHITFHSPTETDRACIRGYRLRQGNPRARNDAADFERVTGIDPEPYVTGHSFETVFFTDDWLFGVVTYTDAKSDSVVIPPPLFLLSPFACSDAVGITRMDADDAFWYLCPPDDGDQTASFHGRRRDGAEPGAVARSIRLNAVSLPFDTETLHVTYDPTGDTLVFYRPAESPFTDPRYPVPEAR